MRNPNFRVRGLWPRQYGGGSGVGSIIVSPTAPSATGYKRADLCTDADIAKLRTAGVLPPAISWAPSKGYGTSQSGLGIGGGTPSFDTSAPLGHWFFAAGDGWVLYASRDDPPQLAGGYVGSSGVRAPPTLTGVTGAGLGLNYHNNAFHLTTTAGMWAFGLATKLQSTPTAVTPGRYGTAAPIPGLIGQSTLFYPFANRWLAWGGNFTPTATRYSNDYATWVNCTLPTLSQNGSSQGNNINSIVIDQGGQYLVGTTSYGEILTSNDGITWTKTHAEPVATNPLIQYMGMVRTPSGKLVQGALTGTASRIYIAPDLNSAFAPVVVPGAFGPSIGAAYHMGVLWAFFSTGASVAAYSLDDGVTWVAIPATIGEGTLLSAGATSGWAAKEGFIWQAQQVLSTTIGFTRIDTDFGRLTAPYADTRTNVVMFSWVKVA